MQNSEVTKDEVIEAVSQALGDMVLHAMSTPDREVVGLVFPNGETHPLDNEHEDPVDHLTVSPAQLAPFLKADPFPVAIYHSHPGGSEYPSVTDEKGLSPFPAVILTPTAAILWWWAMQGFYYRIWDHSYGIE